MRRESERLEDILDAIAKIEEKTNTSLDNFLDDEMLQVWVLHHLQIIGEASNKLSPQLQQKNLQIPWSQIVALRNIIVHEYFQVDLEDIWQIVKRDLATLKQQIKSILGK